MRTSLPTPDTPFFEEDGQIAKAWYLYFSELQNLSGASQENFPQYQELGIGGLSMEKHSQPPTRSTFLGSTEAYKFAAGSDHQLLFQLSLPRGADEQKAIYPYVIWAPEDDTAGDVLWSFDYVWDSAGEASSTTSTAQIVASLPSSGREARKVVRSVGITAIAGTGKLRSSAFTIHMQRKGTDALDTYAAGAFLMSAGVLYQNSLPGSVDL